MHQTGHWYVFKETKCITASLPSTPMPFELHSAENTHFPSLLAKLTADSHTEGHHHGQAQSPRNRLAP